MKASYSIPVLEWDRFQLLMIKLAADTAGEMDVRQLRQQQAQAWYRRRILGFKSFVEGCERKVSVSSSPCRCGRNHFSIILKNSEDYLVCPVIFWLNMCQIERLTAKTTKWAAKHPIGDYLHRIDPDKDGTYEPDC